MSPVERRIKAAVQLAGFESLDDVADRIDRSGFSRKTLRRIANPNDKRQAKDYELEWIAQACDVPLSFLLEGPAEPDSIRAQLARVEAVAGRLVEVERKLDVVLRSLGVSVDRTVEERPVPDAIPDLPTAPRRGLRDAS